ncbi:MAG: DUF308 domain-containing protein [Spirochaetales bacterium]|nr:DUF308 domain-containing protein [Spirochaetales bacterium]
MKLKNSGIAKFIIVGIAALAVGILVMNHTDALIKIVMIAAGIGACVDGFYTIMGIKKWNFTEKTKTLATIKGYESMVLGLAAILIAIFAADTAITVRVWIFAIGLLFSAVVAFENASVSGKTGVEDMRKHFLVEGVIELLVAIILFFKPVDTMYTLIRILAVILIIAGAIMIGVPLVVLFKGGTKEEVVEEAEVVEEKTE